ncbi:uncharacterized protein dgrn [Calliphora vicina]|uniref:uncharacterized protein dgrn n=1 Tax=Calliphora vicina TaxID=7373 RepID=UPI00325BFC25
MTSRKRQQDIENRKTDYAAQSPGELNDESVDDMLANVDQFIQGVYRDLSISPPRRHSLENNFRLRRSLHRDSSVSPINISPDEAPVVSPTTRRNMDAEIERINQICDNVDQNLRSIGLYMNNSSDRSTSEDILNSNLTRSPPSTSASYVVSHNSPPLSTIGRNDNLQMGHQRRRSSPIGSVIDNFIDLSESQTPVVPSQRVHQNNIHVDDEDDDVILVSANIHPVVDLCTPAGYQEESNPRTSINQRKLSRRRLTQQDEDETCCQAGPTSARKRRTEYFTPPEHSKKPSESSNVATSPSATSASGGTPFMCPICMESCLQRQPTSTRCGHLFCKECIECAIRLTHKCPMCNSKISRNQIIRIYL